MRIYIQEELKNNTYGKYKKQAQKDVVASVLLSVGLFLLAGLCVYLLWYLHGMNHENYPLLVLMMIPVIWGSLLFSYGFTIRASEAAKDIQGYNDHIKWLNEHKEFAYCEGEVWDSLESCKYVPLSEVNDETEKMHSM